MRFLLEDAVNSLKRDFQCKSNISEYELKDLGIKLNADECNFLREALQNILAKVSYPATREVAQNEVILPLLSKKIKPQKTGNCVYFDMSSTTPLTPVEISTISGIPASYYEGKNNRLAGSHCHCNGNGEFVVVNDNDLDSKSYIRCRICGGYSHL